MDIVAYLKDRVKQPSGAYTYVYKNDVFDFHVKISEAKSIEMPNTIVDTTNDYVEDSTWIITANAKVEDNTLIIDDEGITEGSIITEDISCEEICDEGEELQQACLFATLKQRGSDPLAPYEGVRWSEAYLGEISQEILMTDIQNAVKSVSPVAMVEFSTVTDANGNEFLTYILKVPSGV